MSVREGRAPVHTILRGDFSGCISPLAHCAQRSPSPPGRFNAAMAPDAHGDSRGTMMDLVRHDRAAGVQVHRVLAKGMSSQVGVTLTSPRTIIATSSRRRALAPPGPLRPARITPPVVRLGQGNAAFPTGPRAAEGAHGSAGQDLRSKYWSFILKRNSANSSGESARRPSSMKKSEAPGPFR